MKPNKENISYAIQEAISKLDFKEVHRIKIEVDFVDFSYNSQELIKPNRIREISRN